jgi:type I restriction enzyme R subunit
MKSFDEYYKDGYEDEQGKLHEPYVTLIERLQNDFPVEGIPNVVDMETKKAFIRLFGEILRLRNLLSVFDEFTDDARLIGDMQYQDYMGWYNKLYDEIRKHKPTEENESITDDIVFEMELVKQVQIDIRYILELVQQYHDTNCQDKEIIVKMRKLIDASPDMRDKKELIERFLERMTPQGSGNVGTQWEDYIEQQKKEQLEDIISEEHLKPAETVAFVQRAFADGYVTETGTGIAKILPPTNPFLPESGEKKQTVIDKLKEYLNRFSGTLEEYAIAKKPKTKTAMKIQLMPEGSLLKDVEDDDDVRCLVHNMMALYEGTTVMNIVLECQREFQERYFSMKTNDWRHLLRDYIRRVTERPDLQEEEVFRYVMAG